jgi:uncharacterized protein
MANNEKDQRGSGNQNDHNESFGSVSGNSKETKSGRSNRGFASMNQERHREISAMGGRASHESGRGHEFDSKEAREAGRKGGQASRGGRGSANATRPKKDDSDSTRSGSTSGSGSNSGGFPSENL